MVKLQSGSADGEKSELEPEVADLRRCEIFGYKLASHPADTSLTDDLVQFLIDSTGRDKNQKATAKILHESDKTWYEVHALKVNQNKSVNFYYFYADKVMSESRHDILDWCMC